MANVFVSLPVPAGDGAGAWVDTSLMAAGKTVSVDGGTFSGKLFIESSNDGQTSAGPVDCPTFTGGTTAPVEIVAAAQWMRVRRSGALVPFGAPTVKIGAPSAVGNVFAGMTVPPADGAGVGTDLSAGGDVNTFNVVGPFSGQVFIDVSTDAGVTWSPAFLVGAPGQTTSGSAVGTNVLAVLGQARVRRVGVLSGVPAPVVSVGSSSLIGGAGAGPLPYDFTPEPVDNLAQWPGDVDEYARGNHVHGMTFSDETAVAEVQPPSGTSSPGISVFPARADHVHILADLLPFDFTGTYFTFDVPVDGSLEIYQNPASSGADFDSHPALKTRRVFDTFPSPGLLAQWDSQYDGGGGLDKGGSFQEWRNLSAGAGAAQQFAKSEMYTTTGTLFAPSYSPIYLTAAHYTTWKTNLLNRLGGGSTTQVEFNSDGALFRPVLFPAAGGPFTYFANQLAFDGVGGEAQVGSSLAYSAITLPTNGVIDGGGDVLAYASCVLDAKNFGSAQGVTHWEWWVRGPTLGDPLTLAMQLYADELALPVGVTLNADAASFSGNVDVTTLNGANAVVAGKAIAVDFLAAPGTSYTFDLPLAAGKKFVAQLCEVIFDTVTGVAAGNLNLSVGNANGPAAAPLANAILNGNLPAASINNASGNTPFRRAFSGDSGPLPDMTTTPISVRINGNPTGVTVLTGRVFLSGIYV